MADWHGYFVVERQNIGSGNWETLQGLFENMGTHDSQFPMYNNHWRCRLDGDAVICESNFDTDEITVDAFKQLLADTFGVDVADIEDIQSVVLYGDYDTAVWVYSYPVGGDDRFTVRRFGRGGEWVESQNECLGYLVLHETLWEPLDAVL